jgi:hypothetical protein
MTNAPLSLTVEAWADIVIKEWVKMAAALDISPKNPLTESRFQKFLTVQANGSVDKITFTFDFYLKFVNWGVGKGVTIENRETLVLAGMTTRRRKPWYDEVFPKQLTILGHLLAERYGQRTVAMIKTQLETITSDGGTVSIPRAPSSGKSSSKSTSNKMTYEQFKQSRKEQGW